MFYLLLTLLLFYSRLCISCCPGGFFFSRMCFNCGRQVLFDDELTVNVPLPLSPGINANFKGTGPNPIKGVDAARGLVRGKLRERKSRLNTKAEEKAKKKYLKTQM